MAFIDGIDSFYQYAKARLATINSQRQVKGHLYAADWPPKDVIPEAFYMIDFGEIPIGRQGYSPTVPIVGHKLQWSWVIKGQDVAAGQVGGNRGSRFRTHQQMKGEILQALYPNFCEKKSWGYDNPQSQSPNWVGTSLNPQEFVHWAPPTMTQKQDRDSGTVYGTVEVVVWDMLDPITS